MPTIKQYTDNYIRWRDMLHRNADRIQRSSEARKYLIKNAETAPMWDLLDAAVECISDLTGDDLFKYQVKEAVGRRRT